ncbi:MAG: hypothetical protein DRJ40_01815 [Thermoprotei archaeon]|nr:MAG: hypothetical protein DRJ40_01815 [Thermoprotei archaeon]
MRRDKGVVWSSVYLPFYRVVLRLKRFFDEVAMKVQSTLLAEEETKRKIVEEIERKKVYFINVRKLDVVDRVRSSLSVKNLPSY